MLGSQGSRYRILGNDVEGQRRALVPGEEKNFVKAAEKRGKNESDGAKKPGREQDNSPHQFQHAAHGDANQAKRQQQQPCKGLQNQRGQRQWPTQHQKNAPQEKLRHFSASLRAGLRPERSTP